MRKARLAARLLQDRAGSTRMEYATVGMMVLVGAALLLQRLVTGAPLH